ncbi:pyruvate/2-oxoglutarate dehydrogenase complex dihydrolipoamide dehydrogenase (E3) component [Microvirga lupini]|uniref:Pyruvate/2-oxoglutarate dehydrogenase complex dihydrolipoamide dehydrogenase (E3) component n=1 Tax=Microvirga lupini TaxID=420324 RepID=A0A7W4VI18_9HYPH|nr:FAD-dependent oxidoreductase [Microvirga lupini]MBB3017605.1 pyruvate/2-oxoglutarate dehydrogenase complex dihydrolipoamide dehydrogenase (E3) component [Microvirga lupini]
MEKLAGQEGRGVLRPDLCVIGAGSAGLSVASIAASLGASVVLIEKNRMGGDCLNVGCVPSKALIAAALHARSMREAGDFGIGAGEPIVDFAKVHAHVKGSIAAIAPMDSVERYRAMGVSAIEGEARFTDAHTVVAGDQTIRARRFVIATGSRPAVPSIPGLEQVPYLTNETIFDLIEKPEHLVVIGGGAVGVEIAQAYRLLGVPVTILESGERLLAQEDPEMAGVVDRALRSDGIAVKTGASIDGIKPAEGEGVSVVLSGGETVEGSHLLVATGRQPVVDGIGLDAAGIAFDASGVLVDRSLKTSNRRVYAIGDCAGGAASGARFTHVANHHAGLVIRNALFRLPVRVGQAPVPRVTYTMPELASVGLTEAQAREQHGTIRILRWAFADNDRARTERQTEGHVKAVVTPRGRILGCSIVGAHAGELIMPWVLAMSRGMKVSHLAGLIYPYPTFSEVTKSTAVEFLKPSAQNPWVRRLVSLVRRLG